MKAPESLATGSKPAPGDLLYVQGFVNTLDVESGQDALSDPAAVAAWFSRHTRLPGGAVVTEEDRLRVVTLRAALRSLMASGSEAHLPADQATALDEVTRRSPLVLTLGASGRLELGARGDDLNAQLAELLVIVHRAQLAGTWDRLKLCAADGCQWAFYDSSRNRSGAWCSMEICGNREKVRTHRAKHA